MFQCEVKKRVNRDRKMKLIVKNHEIDPLLSPVELSKLLKVSKPWPYVMVKRGLLPCYKMGKVIRFKQGDIEDYLERCRIERKGRD